MRSTSQPVMSPLASSSAYDVAAVRATVPALHQEIANRPLVYLDNAASTLRPERVLEAVDHFERHDYSNVHRGIHELSQRATTAFEAARTKVASHLGASRPEEVIFVRGTTEAINLVAQTYGRSQVSEGDVVLVSEMEHHSNMVPWQLLCLEKGAQCLPIPMCDRGELRLDELDRLLDSSVKVVAVTHVSNALGTINPIREIAAKVHEAGAVLVVDGAQGVPHLRVDVAELDCDFYAMSGHKVYAPSGVGVLWGRHELLDSMPPWHGGGNMIRSVSFEQTDFNELPHKFEAGTPNITGAVGLGAAIDLVDDLGPENIARHEAQCLQAATEGLLEIEGVRILGTASSKASVLSFVVDGVHPHDVGALLDRDGVAVRAGHHCAQPVMQHFGVPSTSRASFGIYNDLEDVERLVAAVRRVQEFFG